jgi:hypothetical protein
MTHNLAHVDDGFAVPERDNSSFIKGKMTKFVDGRFVADKTEVLPNNIQLVAVGVATEWVRWDGKEPPEHRVTRPGERHPERDELPDQDQSQWPPGLNDEPSDPWRDSRRLHLISPQTGGDFTFVTDSIGGRRAVSDLKSAIRNVRTAHPNAVPIVELASVAMKTRFGMKQRPDFKVVGWLNGPGSRPAAFAVTNKPGATLIPSNTSATARREEIGNDIPS